MNAPLDFSQKLRRLRTNNGYSQEKLADLVGVSRQAISKWESGLSYPDMGNLIALSDIFALPVDRLIREELPLYPPPEETGPSPYGTRLAETGQEEPSCGGSGRPEDDSAPGSRETPKPSDPGRDCQEGGIYIRFGSRNGYEYKSSRTLFGVPLVHINLGRGKRTAAGIIAVGNCARGVVALGLASAGVLSFGLVSVGLLAFSLVAVGLAAVGCIALGGVAVGAVAAGYFSIGAAAAGVYAVGGAAWARDVAVGAWASGRVAVGRQVQGEFTLIDRGPGNSFPSGLLTVRQVRELILSAFPDMQRAALWWLTAFFTS